MEKKLLYLLFISSFITLQAQEKHLFSGRVLSQTSTIKEAHIINLKTNQGTFSNDFGEYKIYASLGDSLKISSVQFSTTIRMITKQDLKSKIIDIQLKEKTYVLEEIVLKKTNLTGSLISDMKRKKEGRKKITAISLGLPNAGNKKMSHIDRKLYTASTSSGGVPLDLLFNVLSGRMKKLREEKKVVEEDSDVEYMLGKIKHFLVSDFKIKEEYHYRFLYFCRSDSLFQKNLIYNELALIKFIQKKSIEFNKTLKKQSNIKE
jgi:hypothetical protein